MRKAVVAVVVVAGVVWLVMWAGALLMRSAVSSGPENAWPAGLGTLSEAAKRYPQTSMSPAAVRLIAAAHPLGIDLAPRTRSDVVKAEPRPMEFARQQIDLWVRSQLRVPSAEIAPLPPELAEYLAGRAGDLAVISALLRSKEPIIWPQDVHDPGAPLPNLLGLMQLQRVLIARAFDRTRAGDAGAWNDLEAASILARSLTTRGELISVLSSLAMARRADAAARKLPLPFPPWLQEMQSFDYRRAVIASYQLDAWSSHDAVYAETSVDGSPMLRRAVEAVMSPYTRMAALDLMEERRRSAMAIAATRRCGFPGLPPSAAWWNVPARSISRPNVDVMWQRVLRFTAEREATLRALRMRKGAPPMPRSSCADGEWVYFEGGFRFSRNIPEGAEGIPLEFKD